MMIASSYRESEPVALHDRLAYLLALQANYSPLDVRANDIHNEIISIRKRIFTFEQEKGSMHSLEDRLHIHDCCKQHEAPHDPHGRKKSEAYLKGLDSEDELSEEERNAALAREQRKAEVNKRAGVKSG